MSEFKCDDCTKIYVYKKTLENHKRKKHSKNFQNVNINTKNEIQELKKRIDSMTEIVMQQAALSAKNATQIIVDENLKATEFLMDARCSELFAQMIDLKGQFALLAKKTTKWCVVCFTNENTHAFMPCRHKCVCEKCAKKTFKKFKVCPICRTKIKCAKQIFELSMEL